MRVLHVITCLTTGGAEVMLLRLLSASSPEFEHAVISLKDEGTIGSRLRELGIPLFSLGLRSSLPNPFQAFSLRKIARDYQPDLIQGWMYHGNLMASVAAAQRSAGIPVIWGIHQSLESLKGTKWQTAAVIRLGARFSKHAKRIIYVSRTSREHHEIFGYERGNSLVIPNGIDCRTFTPDDRVRGSLRSELGLPQDALLVGLPARYDPIKDHRSFLGAAASLAKEYPQVRFVLFGADVTMGHPVLRQIVTELNLQDRVFLLGERSDMPRILAAMDICCSSSWGEAFSLAIAEAMACAVTCVVTDVGDSAHIVGETGISVPSRNPAALAQAIGALIKAGPENRRKLGMAARRRIESRFSLPEVVRQYEGLYHDVVGSRLGCNHALHKL